MRNKELEEIIEKYDLVGRSYDFILDILIDKGIGTQTDVNNLLEYINLHYALPKSAITELSKDENVREILVKYRLVEEENDLSKELYLTCDDGFEEISVVRVDDFEKEIGSGYSQMKTYHHLYEGWSWKTHPKFWRKSTPQEIESMLIKKLEADGLKVGCMVEREWNKGDNKKINKIKYNYSNNRLTCDGIVVYLDGKFAKIIQPELTLEQRIERLEKLNNLQV